MSSGDLRSQLTSRAAHAGVGIAPADVAQLEAYFHLLQRWNRRINLTALRLHPAADRAIDRLLIEPLAAAQWVETIGGRWIDLGSGGGSPAIPLKIVRPQWSLTMVESRGRKAAFLRAAARELGLAAVEILDERFEALPDLRPDLGGMCLLVTVRAVRVDAPLFELCRWLLAPGGRLFLFGVQNMTQSHDQSFESNMVELGHSGKLMILIKRNLGAASTFHVEHSH